MVQQTFLTRDSPGLVRDDSRSGDVSQQRPHEVGNLKNVDGMGQRVRTVLCGAGGRVESRDTSADRTTNGYLTNSKVSRLPTMGEAYVHITNIRKKIGMDRVFR